ncbi:MAG TPA: M1 family metallopeptidase [Parasegetibacter sp.]|jgi:hypothetical protein
MLNRSFLFLFAALVASISLHAQANRWQQKVKYDMDIQMDVTTNKFTGKQRLEYWNNSPDTLRKVFYHLYWNAFQPNSMMDVRSQELGKRVINGRPDWDARVRDRISKLKEDEIGYQRVHSLTMDGRKQQYKVHETILEVVLDQPIRPGARAVFEMDFEAQVPVQIRRSGRDNAEGVRYSMAQWYPKMAEYDHEGWHAHPYIAREFHGVWGDFNVRITIDRDYIIGGTGYLTNAQQIGYGYENPGAKVNRPQGKTLTWNFHAPNVHDFVWAADPTFKLVRRDVKNGPSLFVLYKPTGTPSDAQWEKIAEVAEQILPFIEENFGEYPYKQYSFIQGGDGGMEYPMATLLKGPGLGTVIHEWMHSWYQMMLATNETLHPWMDEGFTSYAENLVSAYYQELTKEKAQKGSVGTGPRNDNVAENQQLPLYHAGAYNNYFALVKSGLEEPLTTHADHYNTNFAYSIASYSKGTVFVSQLEYIMGESNLKKTLLEYYRQWRFKHPTPNDFIRVAEKVSGLQLGWYLQYFVNTTKTINYGIDSLWEQGGNALIRLRRINPMPMPIDVEITYKDGTKELHYIPLGLMFGEKPNENPAVQRVTHDAWQWTHPTYSLRLSKRLTEVVKVEIDPSWRMADVDRNNNVLDIKW